MTLEYFLARFNSGRGGSAEVGMRAWAWCPFPSLGNPGAGRCPDWPKTPSRQPRGCLDGNVNCDGVIDRAITEHQLCMLSPSLI